MAPAIATSEAGIAPRGRPRKPAPLIVLSTAELAPVHVPGVLRARPRSRLSGLRQVGTVTGVEIRGPVEGRDDGDPERPTRSRSSPSCTAASTAARRELLAARARAPGAARRRRAAGLPARDAGDPRGRLDVAPVPADLQDRRVEITGPGRPQDGHQRAQLGRALLHGRLRGRELADLGELRRGPGEPDRRDRADDRARHGREELPAERRDRDAARPAARLAPRPSATSSSTASHVSASLFDFGLYLFHNGAAPARPRHRPVLLPAEAREPPRGAPLERRLRLRRGRARPRRAARSRRRC